MPIATVETIWRNGALIPWADAQVHVLSHALHYGTSVFEGIRVYETPAGPRSFRLRDHIRRLIDSARIYDLVIPFDEDALVAGCDAVVAANGLRSAYIRPIAMVGYGEIGVAPLKPEPVETFIAAFPWGAYLGETAREQGVDVCVSSWNRLAPNTAPTGAKAAGNYLTSFLISREAKKRGYAEGIGLDIHGRLSEGAGENLFLFKDGRLMTPPAASSILQGITRDAVIELARREGIEVVEQSLPREALYLCDEAFLTGTAAEITPIRSVDDKPTRAAGPGEITRLLQDRFFGLFEGGTEDEWGWLQPVSGLADATV
ncbi:branched chain amino acid aminotransferase [Marinicauda salina]|uniref:Branched-chain-amino-acid aminotransferase n=1 Tax=Marinicauda salina TaxID=2135793 RepID=A0A2U2BS60_9PROT|nr:branched-chain amino acid transaminase [Marinicauda salina]PWE16839.1 branched chain amino acid aminotransferase [Marinicauda salina]